jgi:hypothetical protein
VLLTLALVIAVAGTITMAAAIGLADDDARQALGWPLLLLVATCTALAPVRRAGLYAALLALALFAAVGWRTAGCGRQRPAYGRCGRASGDGTRAAGDAPAARAAAAPAGADD